jgi:hypothetical protein
MTTMPTFWQNVYLKPTTTVSPMIFRKKRSYELQNSELQIGGTADYKTRSYRSEAQGENMPIESADNAEVERGFVSHCLLLLMLLLFVFMFLFLGSWIWLLWALESSCVGVCIGAQALCQFRVKLRDRRSWSYRVKCSVKPTGRNCIVLHTSGILVDWFVRCSRTQTEHQYIISSTVVQ